MTGNDRLQIDSRSTYPTTDMVLATGSRWVPVLGLLPQAPHGRCVLPALQEVSKSSGVRALNAKLPLHVSSHFHTHAETLKQRWHVRLAGAHSERCCYSV
jgi:hypothetical protein